MAIVIEATRNCSSSSAESSIVHGNTTWSRQSVIKYDLIFLCPLTYLWQKYTFYLIIFILILIYFWCNKFDFNFMFILPLVCEFRTRKHSCKLRMHDYTWIFRTWQSRSSDWRWAAARLKITVLLSIDRGNAKELEALCTKHGLYPWIRQ